MPIARANGVDIYYEETGSGIPLVWSHEFGGDHRSWEPQVRYFGRRYRVITYNHRGYPPSEVVKDPAGYSNTLLDEDLYQLLRGLGIRQAHIGGLSMGANVALNFGIAHPDMAKSLIIAACGSGSVNREQALAQYAAHADALEREGIGALLRNFDGLASRKAFRDKDPRGWDEFRRYAADHSPPACAHVLRSVIMRRKTIFEIEAALHTLAMPALVMVGDQDEACVRAVALHAPAHPAGRTGHAAHERAHDQHRGARALQRPRGRVPRRRGARTLGWGLSAPSHRRPPPNVGGAVSRRAPA